jgi:hypothetical protein
MTREEQTLYGAQVGKPAFDMKIQKLRLRNRHFNLTPLQKGKAVTIAKERKISPFLLIIL